jgi:cell volume regulation protein A
MRMMTMKSGMRALLLAAPLLLALVLVVASSPAAANVALGQDLRIVEVDEYAKQIFFGENATFRWGVINDGPLPQTVTVNATTTDLSFAVSVSPSELALGPGDFLVVQVDVTAPPGGQKRATTINATFAVSGSSPESVTVQATLVAVPAGGILDVLTGFVAVGAIIVIGFTASLVFERTKIPDLLVLILLGLLLGPVAATYFDVVIVDPVVLETITPYFAALALVVILFDGGLNLNFHRVIRKAGIAFVHTAIAFVLTVLAIAAVTHYVFGYEWILGLLMGAILGGISGAVVITIVRGMNIAPETETILTIESVLTDVLCIIAAISILEVLKGGTQGTLPDALARLSAAFFVAFGVGLVAGLLWLKLLHRLQGKPFSFMLTVAALFLLYAGVEFLKGSGAMAALVFGLVLGNAEEFGQMLRTTKFVLDEKIRQFHSELSFLVRTFFFVFLGLVFSFNIAARSAVASPLPVLSLLNDTIFLFLLGIGLIVAVIVGTRWIATSITVYVHRPSRPDKGAMVTMMGRGLAAAVLASLPFSIPAYIDPSDPAYVSYRPLVEPFQDQFLTVAFLVIIFTVAATTIGVVHIERKAAAAGVVRRPPEEGEGTEPAAAKPAVSPEAARLHAELQEIDRELRKDE